jgi:hypothetical protein
MSYGSKEFVAAIEMDRAREVAREAMVSEALAGRPRRSRRALFGRALVWLGNRLVLAGDRLTVRVTQTSADLASHEFGAEQANF